MSCFRSVASQLASAALLLLAFNPIAGAASSSKSPAEAFASREYFYVGGEYVNTTSGTLFANQMYVEKLTPEKTSQPYPLVFIHGQAQTGTNWLNKPDGGAGWATYFLNQGYIVYIIDQTERARSAWNPNGGTTQTTYSAEIIEQRFTAPAVFKLWPQASLHTQWPGTGLMGDPIFDAYYASNVQFQSDTIAQETKMQKAGAALLDKIGEAVLISHSQGGLMPWVIADVRPKLVKAILSLEPTGPPFIDEIFSVAPTRPYGLTDIPLTYDPPPTDSAVPLPTMSIPNNSSGLSTCLIQAEPARQLVNFKNIPVLLETSEASYHAVYDDCTYQFLLQAGVPVQRLKLADEGIHGNGHLHFMEKNSDTIVALLDSWIKKTV
ncbi:Alpha/Beta hydrolase protein [Xylogone sp. PMI_703]|nr:Alpha/Beta hydrolase protein [Xylogone sp. PMI_703]